MQAQTIIQHTVTSKELVNQIAEALFENHLKPFVQQLGTVKPEERFYTRRQTAKRLNIGITTLFEHTRAGKIKAQRIGTRVLYSEEAINEALKVIRTK